MKKELEQTIIHLSSVLVIPNSMPECLKILEITPIPILNRYLVKKDGIVIQGIIENTIDYVYLCPIDHVEKSKRLKFRINFARFMEIRDLKVYSTINLRANLEWKEFSYINPRNIRLFQIICVNPMGTLKSKD